MIQPIYLTLDKLLQGRLFEIPDYQRTYSWTKKQRADLFGDIKKLKGYAETSGRDHFMATVVCLETKTPQTIGADEFQVLKIVDGQQRLTTIIILLKEIFLALDSKDKIENKTRTDLDELLIKRDKRLIILQINHDSSNIFKNYLREAKDPPSAEGIKIQADLNLANAIKECREFVAQWENDGLSIIALLRLVKNRLGFVLYILDDEAPVYTVFEVLNSRGLDVDSLDKCKSMLMGVAFEKCGKAKEHHIRELHENWKKIYQFMGKRLVPGYEILRFTATFLSKEKPSETLGEEDSLSLFAKICDGDPNKVISISQNLLNVAEKLEELYRDPRREAVTQIIHARLLAISILLSDSFKVDERVKLLNAWEKITFRIFGMHGKDARTKRGDFTKLAWDIYNKKITAGEALDTLEKIGQEFPIDEAVNQLAKQRDCYNGWQEELRYFFYRYEEFLVKQEGSSVDKALWEKIWSNTAYSTIEHIFPQQPSGGWSGKMGKGRDTVQNNVNRLGNLLLLSPGKNSEAYNREFKDKKEIYKKIPLRIIRDVTKVADWTKDTIDKRERIFLEWAKQEWK